MDSNAHTEKLLSKGHPFQTSILYYGQFAVKIWPICLIVNTWFPPGLENLEKREGIFQSGKSQGILIRLEKSGNIAQNAGKSVNFK